MSSEAVTSQDHRPDEHHHHLGYCSDALAELYTFLDGELTDDRRSAIREHLDDCTPCFEAFDFEAELRIVIQQRCREEVPDDLRQRILAVLDEQPGAGA